MSSRWLRSSWDHEESFRFPRHLSSSFESYYYTTKAMKRVPPICPVRRSKSFPNESETTDHAAELEDFLSSRSGVTELSMDKQETDEEEDHWKDASPITPTCSPKKRPSKLPQGERSSKTVAVDVREFEIGSPSSLHEKDVIIIESGTSLVAKISARYSQDVANGVEKVTPKVKLKRESSIEIDRSIEKLSETEAPASTQKRTDVERRRRSLRRYSSVDSEEKGLKEAVNRSESSEKGAKKKLFQKKDVDRDKRHSRKKIDREEEEEIFVDASRKEFTLLEAEVPKKREFEGVVYRSREERKSLKEQECIERVTEFLTKHSVLNYPEITSNIEYEADVPLPPRDVKEELPTRPSSLIDPSEKLTATATKDRKEGIERLEDSKGQAEVTKTPSTTESDKAATVVSAEVETPVIKRPSSLRKKRATFSRESSKESLLDETKKEVRIQENVEEIFFEDMSDQISSSLPEVQLVKARIITVEEAAANRLEEPAARIEVHSPPEIAVVPDSVKVKSGRVPSPETVGMCQLQLVSLAKSTSENALIETCDPRKEENKVSERNIKAEILLDLSKVPDVGEEIEETVDEEKERRERKLTRTGSEGSKRSGLRAQAKLKDRGGFKIGCLAQPDEPELTILLENAADEKKRNVEVQEDLYRDTGSIGARPEESKEEATPRLEEKEVELPSRKLLESEQRKEEKKLYKEEEARETVEKGSEDRDYERILRQQKPPLLEETAGREEDSLISKEHSLEYQSQTLETQQSDHLLHGVLSTSLENLLRSVPESWSEQVFDRSVEEVERRYKETQYSPKEKCDAETQTEQETKSTQCSPEQSIISHSELSNDRPLRIARSYYQSPKREVETQTQGESKSVQCCLDELDSLGYSRSFDFEDSLDSPSKSERTFVKESKSIQCIPEDISTSPSKSLASGPRSSSQDRSFRSPRREVEVQTYQESKAIQCSDDELLEAEYVLSRYQTRLLSRPPSSVSPKTESLPSSSCSSPCKFTAVVFVEESTDMTVTHRDHDGNVNWSKHWGPERLVEIYREPKTSLGLSIVGGKVDLHNGSSSKSQNISGIFIKNVLPNSPAGRTGELKIGDRIIEVDGVDLRHSTHERAVEVIQAAGNPVCLLVQSLVHLNTENDTDGHGEDGGRAGRRQSTKSRLPASGASPGSPTSSLRQKPSPASPSRSITPEVIQTGAEEAGKQGSSRSDFRRQSTKASDGAGTSTRRSSMKKSIRKKAPSPPSNPGILREVSEEKEDNVSKTAEKPPARRKYSSDESSEEDTRDLEGNVYTKAGMEISRKSAGNVKRSREEIERDPEQEDEFGYTKMKVQKKYHNIGHKVFLIKVEKDRRGLGISLAGHRDRNRMAVFICGLNPKGSAHKSGELAVGDEILEVNGCVLQGRCHLNASAIIKGMAGTCFKIVVLRRSTALDDIAVKPIAQFPPTFEDSEIFNQYKGVRNMPVKKGQYGLGIMIIEGKHAEVGQGIFISDIQEGSAAEQAGLQVGDMILAVNMDCLLGSTYDEATSLLKKAEGVVTLTVCNPNQSKVAKEEEDRAKGIIPEVEKPAVKEPEKPKEPEPPKDPKDCKIAVGKDTTIEFQKEKDKGIGFTICGGSDTPLKGVFIIEVFPDGAAGKDGRLQAGDQILDMCAQSFKEVEHDKAHATVLKVSGTITMIVHRAEKAEEEIEVELQKKSGKGAGLCLTGYKSDKGAYVSDLLPGGSALESGKICKGDRVVAVGGQDVREAPVEDIAVHVKVSNPVQLKLARFKSAKP